MLAMQGPNYEKELTAISSYTLEAGSILEQYGLYSAHFASAI
jgi:hypothetical protein